MKRNIIFFIVLTIVSCSKRNEKTMYRIVGKDGNVIYIDTRNQSENFDKTRKSFKNQKEDFANNSLEAEKIKNKTPKEQIKEQKIPKISSAYTLESVMDKNIKLATYASRCIDNEILMYLRKNKKVRTEISFDESLSFDADGNELHLEDILGTDPDIVTRDLERETERNLVMEEINKLGKRDKEIIMLRYGLMGHKEMTQKDVAELLGISQSYISRIEKKVIRRLKNLVKC